MNQTDYETSRCPKCLMPLSAPGVYLANGNMCNICRDYQQLEVKGEASLLELLNCRSGKPQSYDCIVPISGGLDSIYTTFYLVKKMGLKCLGIHYNTGMRNTSAKELLAWLEEKLGITILYKKLEPHKTKRMIRNSVRSLLTFGPKSMQTALCRHCGYGIRASVYSTMVAEGLNSVWGTHTMDIVPFRYCQSVGFINYLFQKRWLYAIRALLGRYKQMRSLPTTVISLRKLLFSEFGYPDISESYSHLHCFAFFDYVEWNKKRMLDELDEAGIDTSALIQPHSDCRLAPILDHILRAAWTVGKKEIYISNQIRAGQLTVEMGAELIKDIRAKEPDTSVLTELGLTNYEIEMLLANS